MNNKLYGKGLVLGTILVLIGAGLIPGVSSEMPEADRGTIIVPDDYPTIQAAVDAAAPGDTVFVRSDLYVENVVITKALQLLGEDRTSTIIDGSGLNVVEVFADMVTVSGFTIQEGGVANHHYGLRITSDGNTITDNIITNSQGNIKLEDAAHNMITDNIIGSHGRGAYNAYGVFLENSTDTTIVENHIESMTPVYLFESDSNRIIGNTFTGPDWGVYIHTSKHVTIRNNSFTISGVALGGDVVSHFNTHSITGNTVNGKPIRYYTDVQDFVVSGTAGQVLLANCTNGIVHGMVLSQASVGIQLGFCQHIDIMENTLSDNIYGLLLSHSNHNTIHENMLIDNYDVTIAIVSSNYNVFSGNDITRNGIGLYAIDIHSNTIKENDFTHNYFGAFFHDSSDNLIYHNNFINNTDQDVFDTGFNQYDNGYPSGGNYWDNYTGVDMDGDGIGDTPYDIAGSGGNQDRYPFMNQSGWENTPPEQPGKPTGRRLGFTFRSYTYQTSTVDPDGDQIFYKFDWGDGTNTTWLGPYDSGELVSADHAWSMTGYFPIKVKAKDIYGNESPWSPELIVRIIRIGLEINPQAVGPD